MSASPPLQDACRVARRKVKLGKPVTADCLRHNAECRIIPSGCPDGVEIRALL